MNDEYLILPVRNLAVDYGANQIVGDLSLEVSKREVLVIRDPHGAGKTTLLRALLAV